MDDLHRGIEDARLAMEDQTVGVGDVLADLLVDIGIFQHREVRAAIINGRTAGDDVGRDVAREGGAGLNHCHVAHAGAGILDDARREEYAVANLAVAGNLRTIADDAVVAHLRVVADMGTLHEEVAVADDRLSALVGGAVDDDILTDDVVVADDAFAGFTRKVEILRDGGNDRTLMNLVVPQFRNHR